jgi:hypothetical protein
MTSIYTNAVEKVRRAPNSIYKISELDSLSDDEIRALLKTAFPVGYSITLIPEKCRNRQRLLDVAIWDKAVEKVRSDPYNIITMTELDYLSDEKVRELLLLAFTLGMDADLYPCYQLARNKSRLYHLVSKELILKAYSIAPKNVNVLGRLMNCCRHMVTSNDILRGLKEFPSNILDINEKTLYPSIKGSGKTFLEVLNIIVKHMGYDMTLLELYNHMVESDQSDTVSHYGILTERDFEDMGRVYRVWDKVKYYIYNNLGKDLDYMVKPAGRA